MNRKGRREKSVKCRIEVGVRMNEKSGRRRRRWRLERAEERYKK